MSTQIRQFPLPPVLVAAMVRINNDIASLQSQKLEILSIYLAAGRMDGRWGLANDDTVAVRIDSEGPPTAEPDGPLPTTDTGIDKADALESK
jgi:hypothetical protein